MVRRLRRRLSELPVGDRALILSPSGEETTRMWPNERTSRSGIVAVPSEIEALVAAGEREAARPLVEFLKAEKLNIAVVSDAEAAFEEALLHRPNLLVIHEDLPPGDGIDLCQRLKSNTRTHFLPVIIVPRADKGPQRVRALAAGADAVFPPGMDDAREAHAPVGAAALAGPAPAAGAQARRSARPSRSGGAGWAPSCTICRTSAAPCRRTSSSWPRPRPPPATAARTCWSARARPATCSSS